LNRKNITIFHAQRPPTITIRNYLERIVRYSPCSTDCYVLALIYIDRIIQQNNHFQLNSLNAHRLLITSILVASKFFDDTFYNNSYHSRVGGITCVEMNALELEFLFLINFNLVVTPENFNCYSTEMSKHLSRLAVTSFIPFRPPPPPPSPVYQVMESFYTPSPSINFSKERIPVSCAGINNNINFNVNVNLNVSTNKRKDERKERKGKKQKTETEKCVIYNNNNSLPFNFTDCNPAVWRKYEFYCDGGNKV